MKHITQKTTIFITAILMVMSAGCTTIKPVYDDEAGTYSEQIKLGGRVRLTYLTGAVNEILVTEVNQTAIMGTQYKNNKVRRKGSAIVAEWADIESAETVKISAIKTAGAGLGIIVALPIIAVAGVIGVAAGGY
jgi:hypothetical protein